MKTVEIYYSSLNPEKQKELLEAVGVDDPADMNWDMDIIPIATCDFEEIDHNGEK